MTTKHYIGKELKAPFDGPKTSQAPNPRKKEPEPITHTEINRVLTLIGNCTDLAQLERITRKLDKQLQAAERNESLPETVTVIHWEGHIANEYMRCGKEGCKCQDGKLHGPYWYHYKRQS